MNQLTTLTDYQEFTDELVPEYTRDTLPDRRALSHELAYNLIGLGEEAGEAQGKIKKAIRRADIDNFSQEYDDNLEARLKLLHELGDVLYYLTRTAGLLGSSLQEVANLNKIKLEDRHARGVVKGEGDDR